MPKKPNPAPGRGASRGIEDAREAALSDALLSAMRKPDAPALVDGGWMAERIGAAGLPGIIIRLSRAGLIESATILDRCGRRAGYGWMLTMRGSEPVA